MSTTSDRPVFLTRWGSTPSSSKSFHHCILVADSSQLTVTSATTGTTFDWGSAAPGGGWMKIRNPSKVKPFNAEAYAKGAICRNTYEYIGTTDWDNARIEQLMNTEGDIYNIINNNCQTVVGNTLGAIRYPAQLNTNDQAQAKNHHAGAVASNRAWWHTTNTLGMWTAQGAEQAASYGILSDLQKTREEHWYGKTGYEYDEQAEAYRLSQKEYERQLKAKAHEALG